MVKFHWLLDRQPPARGLVNHAGWHCIELAQSAEGLVSGNLGGALGQVHLNAAI